MNQEEKLMDYLYGEMNPTEKQAFEKVLAQSPTLQQELKELQAGRDFLADLPDVAAPATIVPLKAKPLKWKKWFVPIGIAASFLILLDIFNFQITSSDRGIMFSFFGDNHQNAEKQEATQYVTLDQVQQLLEKREAAHRKDLLMMDSIWQNRIMLQEQNIQENWNKQLIAYQAKQQKNVKAFVKSLRQEEIPELVNLMHDLQAHQQKELKILLGELWENWEDARSTDLNAIRKEFANVYQTQNQTDALLVNMIENSGD